MNQLSDSELGHHRHHPLLHQETVDKETSSRVQRKQCLPGESHLFLLDPAILATFILTIFLDSGWWTLPFELWSNLWGGLHPTYQLTASETWVSFSAPVGCKKKCSVGKIWKTTKPRWACCRCPRGIHIHPKNMSHFNQWSQVWLKN